LGDTLLKFVIRHAVIISSGRQVAKIKAENGVKLEFLTIMFFAIRYYWKNILFDVDNNIN